MADKVYTDQQMQWGAQIGYYNSQLMILNSRLRLVTIHISQLKTDYEKETERILKSFRIGEEEWNEYENLY